MEGTPVTVESVREVGPDTVALELETPAEFDALPGQFVLVRAEPDGVDEELARHYTLSSPSVGDTFEITVGIDPDGDLSPWLADLDSGTTIHIDGPFGNITYEGDQNVVAIAGGPGVGPAISIAEAAHAAGQNAVVIYQDDAPAHRERLDVLEDDGAPVTIVEDDADDELVAAIEGHLDEGQVYAFGFAEFVTLVSETIEEAGGDSDEALIENFG
ncbi:oxidoreductase FAD-binding domain-containing protein [Natrialba chahannaoensis JCM 10990]|uniref:Oxidoreductase FAD-binding domain-containing protein n=1 Tax=Natrialba chahannaoensis JCM 10990 TaxID=1227492 RepID=M0ARX1_9EURY|nr:FAD-dependent oxidoreductase [Natrialba chahannaoensis]ELZ01057.1 oxidoreductase FAD-binding domain-containing protein [Natrialba chahannaoensis JCM 10990]